MKISIKFATAAAVSVLMASGALAGEDNVANLIQSNPGIDGNSVSVDQSSGDDNRAFLTQLGESNLATILQDGNNNTAGYTVYSSSYGDMVQNGNNNTLHIDQTSNGNQVANNSSNARVKQIGNYNLIDIDQLAHGSTGTRVNRVTRVEQASSGSASQLTNMLTVTQEGFDGEDPSTTNDNYAESWVRAVLQTHSTGAANELTINQAGGTYNAGNTVYLALQDGSGNVGNVEQTGTSNMLTTLSQLGDANSATVTQTGSSNLVVALTQDNTGSGALGNSATLNFTGDSNGVGSFSGLASSLSLGVAEVSQLGDDNLVSYTVDGNSNLFGFEQIGDGNSSVATVTGNDNQAAISQNGNNNDAPFTQLGDNNNIAVSQ